MQDECVYCGLYVHKGTKDMFFLPKYGQDDSSYKSDNSFGLFNGNASVCDIHRRPFQPR